MHLKNSYAIQITLFLWMLICQMLPARASFVGNELFAYEHIGFADGLTSQRVYSLVEGQYGEIWISTKNGLARFFFANPLVSYLFFFYFCIAFSLGLKKCGGGSKCFSPYSCYSSVRTFIVNQET